MGHAPGSPYLANVKVDLSRMAANVASGVGFIGAGAIHKSKLHGNGTEAQNVVLLIGGGDIRKCHVQLESGTDLILSASRRTRSI